MESIIKILIDRHKRIRNFLEEKGEISLTTDSDNEFRKVLVLSIASFFESEITESLLNLARSVGSEQIFSLIKSKAVSRQYHTLFDWKSTNVNQFLQLLGDSFKKNVEAEIKENDKLGRGVKAFLELGQKRNSLVHENFISAQLDWTLEDISEKYQYAFEFVTFLSKRISP